MDRRLGQPTILLDEELARAVRHEAAAIRYWWGVNVAVIARWRKILGVSRTNNEGNARLIQAACQQGAEDMKRRDWTDEEREQRRQRNRAMGLAKKLIPGYRGPRWTQEDIALLGQLPDQEAARRAGRSVNAVRPVGRCRLHSLDRPWALQGAGTTSAGVLADRPANRDGVTGPAWRTECLWCNC